MKNNIKHTVLSKSILKTLLYFDVFQYPLTADEIFALLQSNHVTPEHVASELNKLKDHALIFPVFDFLSVHNNSSFGSRRIKGNQMAQESLELARKQALLISKFPFVRGVMASGSLSKNYMDEFSDLDFFVITKPNRLWLARLFLGVYQKLVLRGSHKYFCVNYFVDEDHLEIQEKNLFTATELATLLPLYGKEYYQQLMGANLWLKKYLPNQSPRSVENVPFYQSGRMQRFLETVFNWSGARFFERVAMKLISSRWKRLYQRSLSKTDYEVAFKAKEYVSKGHVKNHQRKVLDRYQQKIEEFGNQFGINWND